jgi:methionyl-tRNA formyltransferase
MGLRLIERTLLDIHAGNIVKIPQRKEFSTFEPNTDVKDVFKPDLLMLDRDASASR